MDQSSSLNNPGDNPYSQYVPGLALTPKEGVLTQADPLTLDIDNEKLADIADRRIDDSHTFFHKTYNLFERRKKLETYLFSRQITESESKNELKIYESRFVDPTIYEITSSIKPLAMSRLPDMIVTPGQEGNEEEIKMAQDTTKVVNTSIKDRQNRVSLGIAFKHRPIYFTGVLKCMWSPEDNDYKFIPIHPDYIEVDHTCQTNNADDMQWIAETIPTTVQEVLLRFPEGKEEFIKELYRDGITLTPEGELKQKDLASEIKIKQIWFTWKEKMKKVTDQGQESKEYEEVNGVMWKYYRCILKKIKNPNWDWQGQEKWFVYDDPSDDTSKREATPQDMMMGALTGQLPPSVRKSKTYRNYFDRPRKPYFFMGYDQWHKIAYDETSEIEQIVRLQESLDKAGKRVVEKLGQRIKHIWSKKGGITGKILQMLDMDNPKQDILVEDEVQKVHGIVPPEPVTPQDVQFMQMVRERMYAVTGADAVRGELQTDVATSNQIAREANYTRADDLVEDTINAACEWMAQWSMQMIKLRYTNYHFVKMLGTQGTTTFIKLRNDMINEGMEVMIKASGTDKLMARNQANDMAKLGIIDPLSYFEDIAASDPEGRLERLMLFKTNPMEYLAKYVMNLQGNTEDMSTMLNGVPPQMPMAVGPMGQQGAQPPMSTDQGAPSTGNAQGAPPLPVAPQGSPRGL